MKRYLALGTAGVVATLVSLPMVIQRAQVNLDAGASTASDVSMESDQDHELTASSS